MKRSIASAMGAILLTVGAATHAAPILENGDFESGLAGWAASGFVLQGYDHGIDNDAQSGTNAFYGGAVESLGFLSQGLATLPGQRYTVSFWLASDGFLSNAFQVLANGNLLLELQDILIQPYGARSVSFAAAGTSTQLQFAFRNDSGFLHLDNVNVSAIPEPSTMLLLAIGLGAIRARRRVLQTFRPGAP